MKSFILVLLLIFGTTVQAGPNADELMQIAQSDTYKIFVMKFVGSWVNYRSGNRQVSFYFQGIGRNADNDRAVLTLSDCKTGKFSLDNDPNKMTTPEKGTVAAMLLKHACNL